nr:maestro heat-like repeat family member 5 [Anas platyrhynchos]
MVHPRCTLLWGTGFLPARRGGERPGLREHEMLVAAGTEPGALHPSCSGLLLRTPAQDSPCLLPSARAMKYVSRTERRRIVLYLETWLNNNEPRWKVPAMAFLVEMLACEDLKMECLRVLQLFPRYLRSECTAMRQLVLKGLKTLSRRPYVAKKMEFLLPEIMGILPDLEGDVAGNALFVLKNMLKEMTINKARPTALQLAERLPAFFDSESSSTQLQSIHFFRDVMSLFAAREKEQLKTHVCQSVIPLFFHLHDENQQVAEAAEETLLDAAKFLQRSQLVDLLERKQTRRLGKYLLEDNSLDEHLRQSLPYLQSPQEPLRLEAVRFIGEPEPRGPSVPEGRRRRWPGQQGQRGGDGEMCCWEGLAGRVCDRLCVLPRAHCTASEGLA